MSTFHMTKVKTTEQAKGLEISMRGEGIKGKVVFTEGGGVKNAPVCMVHTADDFQTMPDCMRPFA